MKALNALMIVSSVIQLPSIAQSAVTTEQAHVGAYTHGESSLGTDQQPEQDKGHIPAVRSHVNRFPYPHTSHHEALAANLFTLPDAEEAARQRHNKISKKQSARHDWMSSNPSPQYSSKRLRTTRSSSYESSEKFSSSSRKSDMGLTKVAIRKKRVPITESNNDVPSAPSTSSSSSSRSIRSSSFDFPMQKYNELYIKTYF